MREASLSFFQELLTAPSPSGYEQPAQRIFRHYIAPFANVTQDVMGNVIGFIPGSGESRPRIMLVGHSDEIGFLVRFIDDSGFLYFGAVGDVCPQVTQGRRINIHTRNGVVTGVVGLKAINLNEARDLESVIKMDAQYIDIGASSKQEAEKLVRIGDPVTFVESFTRLQGDRVTSRGFDDKAGSFVVAEVLRHIASSSESLPVDLYGVSSVQEEIGLRGTVTCTYAINPDVGICVEVDSSTDQPDLDMKSAGDIRLGRGPILPRGSNINPQLFDLLASTAEKESIPVQYSGLPRVTKTDANVMQVSRSGIATALVKIPLRYMHSPVEVISLSDVDHAINLLVKTLARIGDKNGFVPL